MHVCNCYLRFESTYGLCCSGCFMHVWKYYLRSESTLGLCFLICRDYARVQLLSEIRIHLRPLLQWLFSHMSRLCTCATTIRDSNPLMGCVAVAVF
ncbi:hypothetical protein CDAR_523151 [Caerostris darwini]|uniref:Uncharacterized protein n=1 Tax=Caerostris darwini TaxID=1538125 RepID=A0AAV4U8T9_9ARAC|nr:hypothetical protein CDAR_523151 [Caerostris darwini]